MTLTDSPDGSDFAPEDAELSTISNLSVGLPGTVPESNTTAEQGDAPADLHDRQTPDVPTPSRDGLSADEVARLTGQDESTVQANVVQANTILDRAEGREPDRED